MKSDFIGFLCATESTYNDLYLKANYMKSGERLIINYTGTNFIFGFILQKVKSEYSIKFSSVLL